MEQNNYLIKLLCDNSDDSFYIDLIKHELDWRIYDYGDHLRHGKRMGHAFQWKDIINLIKYFYLSSFPPKGDVNSIKVLSLAPGLDNILRGNGYMPYSIINNVRKKAKNISSLKFLYYTYKMNKIIRTHSFNEMINGDLDVIKKYYRLLKQIVLENDFKALVVFTDEWFMERIAISVFHSLGIPTILFTHGLPGLYHLELDNHSDFLLTWGCKIRDNYIIAGFNPDKVYAIGNMKYTSGFEIKKITWDDSRIVVIPESSFVYHQHTYSEPYMPDRSRMLYYLYEVEFVLKNLGYKKAYYRPHPSLNRRWFDKYIDSGFYEIDCQRVSETLSCTTLAIGATSSIMLEYIMSGKNYIIYERSRPEQLAPPFDGSDKRIPFANNTQDLAKLIESKALADGEILNDYMQPFDEKVFVDILKKATNQC